MTMGISRTGTYMKYSGKLWDVTDSVHDERSVSGISYFHSINVSRT